MNTVQKWGHGCSVGKPFKKKKKKERQTCKIRGLLCILTEHCHVACVWSSALWMESADPATPCSTTDSACLQLGHWALPMVPTQYDSCYLVPNSYERLSDHKCWQSNYASNLVRMGLLFVFFSFQF